jgi:hypothetical protein
MNNLNETLQFEYHIIIKNSIYIVLIKINIYL